MGSIGPDPAELVLEALIYYLIIGALGGSLLYQFQIMRRLFAVTVYFFSFCLIAFLFFPSAKHVMCHDLFLPAVAYGISAYYLARRHIFTLLIKWINLVYLAIATFFTLQASFTANYESAVVIALMDLAICIASYLFVPLGMHILLSSFKTTQESYKT